MRKMEGQKCNKPALEDLRKGVNRLIIQQDFSVIHSVIHRAIRDSGEVIKHLRVRLKVI